MKVLVVHTSRIGDLVSGMGVVNFLREKFGRVHVLPDPRYSGLLEGEPGIVTVTPDEARKKRYDLLIDLSSSKKSMQYTGTIHAEKKICLYSSFPKLLCSLPFYDTRLKRTDRHLVRTHSPVLRYFGGTGQPVPALTDNRNFRALRVLEEMRGGKKLAGIHFDASSESRFLPEDLVTGVIEALRIRGVRVLLLGTRGDIAHRLVERSGGYARWDEFTLAEVKTVIAGLDLFIGTDSGLLHIAAAFRSPSIGIYGPNIPEISGPIAPGVRFIELPLDCRPCNQNRACPHGLRCLREIPVERVIGEADAILRSHARSNP